MKKFSALIVVLALCLACLAGCGGNADSQPAASASPTETAVSTAAPDAETGDSTVLSTEAALTIGDRAYTVAECNIYFACAYYDFMDTYGSYASMFGLDTSTGLAGLKEQACDYSSDGTWFGYFMDSAVSMMTQVQALTTYAAENGIALSDEMLGDIDSMFDELDSVTAEYGYESGDAYLVDAYGPGVTRELYRAYALDASLADEAYYTFVEGLSFTEEELAEHYAQMGYEGEDNDYPLTAMRHILIMAEEDENGEYTDEAIAAAHAAAEELYQIWKDGEQTEESFAELAEQYTDDGGSMDNGGLYEDIYKDQMVDGINNWLFEEGRAAGDTAVIDNNGSYVGTHIVYFVGQGELYSTALAREDLMDTVISDWFEGLTADCTTEQGTAYDQVGNF